MTLTSGGCEFSGHFSTGKFISSQWSIFTAVPGRRALNFITLLCIKTRLAKLQNVTASVYLAFKFNAVKRYSKGFMPIALLRSTQIFLRPRLDWNDFLMRNFGEVLSNSTCAEHNSSSNEETLLYRSSGPFKASDSLRSEISFSL